MGAREDEYDYLFKGKNYKHGSKVALIVINYPLAGCWLVSLVVGFENFEKEQGLQF